MEFRRKESFMAVIAQAERELERVRFEENMLSVLHFCKQIIQHPEKTMVADPAVLEMSSQVVLLLYELGGEQNEQGIIHLHPFQTRRDVAMAILAASATFPVFSDMCGTNEEMGLQDAVQSESHHNQGQSQLTCEVDTGSAYGRALTSGYRGADSGKHSVAMVSSGQLVSAGYDDVVSERDKQKLEDTARYAAGPKFSVTDAHLCAAGSNAKVELHQCTIVTKCVESLKGGCSLEGRYKIVIMQNFAFHLFFLTTRMPFSVLGAQCNELKREYMASDIMNLYDLVIKYTEAAASALGLWKQDVNSQGSIIIPNLSVLKRVYDKYVSIKKMTQRSLEAVKYRSDMPAEGVQQYCLIWQQKDELAQELRIHLQSSSLIEPYVYFIFDFHWRLAYLNAKWSFALSLRLSRMPTASEQQIEKHEADDFLKLTRRIPQIFTSIYVQGLQGARYLFSLLHNGGQLDAHQFTMQLSYIRWLSDSMKSNLIMPDTNAVSYLDLHIPTSLPDDQTCSELLKIGMHTVHALQAENLPQDMLGSTDTADLFQQDSQLELALEMSRLEQQTRGQSVDIKEDEELDMALALSASEAEHYQLSEATFTANVGAKRSCRSAERTLKSNLEGFTSGFDSGIGSSLTASQANGRSAQQFAGTSIYERLDQSPRKQDQSNGSTAQVHVSSITNGSSSIVSDSSLSLLFDEQTPSHRSSAIAPHSDFDQSSLEMKRRRFKSNGHDSQSRQSACINRHQMLSQISVLTKQCEGNPDLDDYVRDLAELQNKIECHSQANRKLVELDRSLLASLVVKYGDQQILSDALQGILQTQNLNHDDMTKLCQALAIDTQDKTDEQLKDNVLSRERTS